MTKEKCIFCNKCYNSPIDKAIDICPECESEAYEEYDKPDFKEMIMTYSDKTLGEYK